MQICPGGPHPDGPRHLLPHPSVVPAPLWHLLPEQSEEPRPGGSSGGGGGGGGGAGSPSLCKAEPSPGARRTVDGSQDGGMIVGVQEETGEEEDVGSENTPPEPELDSSTLTQSQAPPTSSAPPSPPSSGSQMEDGRVLLDTWYVIKPGNTKEKIAFFVAHQFSGAGQPRPSAMKVKGNWATDCSKAKRRRRCSSYDPPTRSQASEPHLNHDSSPAPPSPNEPPLGGVNETDLLSVAEMVALVEQRTAMALQGIVAAHGNQHQQPPQHHPQSGPCTPPAHSTPGHGVGSHADGVCVGQQTRSWRRTQESCRVAQAIAHFESQNLENRLNLGAGPGIDSSNRDRERERRRGGESGIVTPPPPPSHSHGELFFLQPPRGPEEDVKGMGPGSGSGMCSLDCANNNGPGAGVAVGSGERTTRPDSPSVVEDCSDPSLCRLYRHVSHDFLEIRFQIQRLLEPRQYMLLLPDHIMVNIFSYLPTRSLAALKCTCHYFKALIETYGVRAVDSRWNQDPLYRDDPCKQCKRQYERGDVSLCRWHPKPYHHDLPYGRSYWMCCRRTDKDTPGCRVGLHDNNWVQQPADGSQPIRTKREEAR
ncbi:F-box only protein 46 [Lates japonicus]|uniref:F-box only protein 46 n=1 Tax=Lates japonicus TaxID=270547 RepID=A0AAD3NC09_LATJO|nr:F-box only protein 46 [Lates japonicus]